MNSPRTPRHALPGLAGKVHPGAAVRAPGRHGDPQNGKVTDPGYRPYTTADLVRRAQAAGMAVIPWTVDDEPTMQSLIDAGVDGLITDYPDRARTVMARDGMTLPRPYPATAG